ncbi:RNase H domain-containing protein [Trichonephila clavipes]|nr:RNase H domain-containing protein [Trichonephila clavipes]
MNHGQVTWTTPELAPNYHTNGRTFQLSTDLTCIAALHAPQVLKRLSTSHQIHLQWIPCHVDLEGNEIADTLAEAGACDVPEPSAPLTFLKIFSRTKHQNKTAWIIPPDHHWYQCSRPRGSLAHGFTRQDQTLPARFRSGHLKTMKFSEGCKSFEMCTNCSSEPASPAHILECLGFTKQDLADDPLLVLNFLKVYNVIDLV